MGLRDPEPIRNPRVEIAAANVASEKVFGLADVPPVGARAPKDGQDDGASGSKVADRLSSRLGKTAFPTLVELTVAHDGYGSVASL